MLGAPIIVLSTVSIYLPGAEVFNDILTNYEMKLQENEDQNSAKCLSL